MSLIKLTAEQAAQNVTDRPDVLKRMFTTVQVA